MSNPRHFRLPLPALLAAYLVPCAAMLWWSPRPVLSQGRDDSEDIIVDPVCKMSMMRKDMKFTFPYQGTMYYFCTDDCKKTAMGDPKKYLGEMNTTKDLANCKVTFLTKPAKVTAGEDTRFLLEFHPRIEGAVCDPKEVVGTFAFNCVVGGRPQTISTPLPLTRYRETGVFGAHTTPPGKGHCDVTFEVKLADGSKESVRFLFEIEESAEYDTGSEYNGAPFSMIVQHQSMHKMGRHWRTAYQAVVQDPPDFAAAAKEIDKVEGYAKLLPKFTPHVHFDEKPEMDALTKSFLADFPALRQPIEGKNRPAAIAAFQQVDADSCTRCHLKFRWDAVQDLSRFPDLTMPPEGKK